MSSLVRVSLDDGGWLLLESADVAAVGQVKAGKFADLVDDLPGSLRSVLGPVAQASRELLTELRAVGPDEVKVEFGVNLKVGAGAVLTRGEAACHLKVTLGWSGGGSDGSRAR